MVPAPVVAQIDPAAIGRNIDAIRRRVRPGIPICAAIKAEAYGHGLEQVLPALIAARVERLAVANLEEALQLRQLGWSRPILCLSPTLVAGTDRERIERAREAVAAGVACTISSGYEARILDQAAIRMARTAHIEIQADSGMGRIGLLAEDVLALLAELADTDHLTVDGIYTHFATADQPALAFAREQLTRFNQLIQQIGVSGISVRCCHAANSAAIFRLPESHLDLVRPGLAVYGYWGGPTGQRPKDLFPAMRVTSRLADVRPLPVGVTIGYGCTFRTERASVIGIVPIGYGDGYRRLFSNDAVMTVPDGKGGPCTVPVVGRVSMDLVTVDLTDVPPLAPGDEITIIDNDPAAPNSVESLAMKLDTIPYEITTLLGPRIPRITTDRPGHDATSGG